MHERKSPHESGKKRTALESGAGKKPAGTKRRIQSEQASGVSETFGTVPSAELGQRKSGLINTKRPMSRDQVLELLSDGDNSNVTKLFSVKKPDGKNHRVCSIEAHERHLEKGLNLFLEFHKCLQEKGKSGEFHLREFAEFVTGKMSKRCKATKKQILRGLRTFMECHRYGLHGIEVDLAGMVDDLFQILDAWERPSSEEEDSESGDGSTYANRPIGIRLSDYLLVMQNLPDIPRSEAREILTNWMPAGVATGLRQYEWKNSVVESYRDKNALHGRKYLLHVASSKGSKGRGRKLLRTLDISGCRKSTIESIIYMCEMGLKWLKEGSYKSDKLKCNNLLRSVCEKLLPNKGAGSIYTVNNLRQQFVANMKQEYGIETAAVLAGHTIPTCIRKYPSKMIAWLSKYIFDRPIPHKI